MNSAAARGGSSSDSDSALHFSTRTRDQNYGEAGPSSATVVPCDPTVVAATTSLPLRHADGHPQQDSEVPGGSQAQKPTSKESSIPTQPALGKAQGLLVSTAGEGDGLSAVRMVGSKASTTPGTMPGTAQPAELCRDTEGTLQGTAPARSTEMRMADISRESVPAVSTAEDMAGWTSSRKAGQEGRDVGPSALGTGATDSSPVCLARQAEPMLSHPHRSSSEPTAAEASALIGEVHSPSRTAAKIEAGEGTDGEVEKTAPDTGEDQRLKEASLQDPGTLSQARGLNIREVEESLAQADDWDFMDDLPASQPGKSPHPDLKAAHNTAFAPYLLISGASVLSCQCCCQLGYGLMCLGQS